MNLIELSSEQTRQMVDARQAFDAWREARQEFLHGYEDKALNALHSELRRQVSAIDVRDAV